MKTTEKKLLSNEEIASFCSHTAMLFQAGIPPMEGMAILQSDAGSPEDPHRLQPGRKLTKSIGIYKCFSGLLPPHDRIGRRIR